MVRAATADARCWCENDILWLRMHRRRSKKWVPIRLAITYTGMTSLVFVAVTGIILFMLGFRLDLGSGQIEQGSLVQFGSTPSGASIAIDGVALNARTSTKATIKAGSHEFSIWRDGYETWQKTVDTKPGALTWLNYALLVPKELDVKPVINLKTLANSLASPEGRSILMQTDSGEPNFVLADVTSDDVSTVNLLIDKDTYTDAKGDVFKLVKWDAGGRYVLVKHDFNSKTEWLVLDTQDVSASKNITRLFDFAITDIKFSGTSGNEYYVSINKDVRKLDLSAGTISRPLINSVDEFSVYESNIITYISNDKDTVDERTVGLYREGDDAPYTLKVVKGPSSTPLHVATTKYFNANYIAISEGSKVTVYSGSYPTATTDDTSSLKIFAEFSVSRAVHKLQFSPTGEYVFVQNGSDFASFDMEYQIFAASRIRGDGTARPVKWLDDNYIWSDLDGKLTIREFDGTNVHTINDAVAGQDAMLTHNGRWLYSFAKTDAGYDLQRVRMILP